MSKVLKNTTYLTSAFVLQKVLAFVYFTLIARILGTTDTGAYTFALSFTTLFAMFIDMGLSPVLVRETAKADNDAKTNRLLNNALSVKLIFALLTYLAVIITINVIESDPLIKTMVYLSGILMMLDSLILTHWAVFRGKQKLKYEASAVVISQAITLGLGTIVLLMRWPLPLLIGAFIVGSTFTLTYAYTLMRVKLKIRPQIVFDKPTLKMLLGLALPFALLGLFTRFYSNLDTVLLKILGGDLGEEWVGLYSVPYKITFALSFIPSAFAAALYPAMSEYFVSSKEKLTSLFERSMYYLMMFALPASVGIAVLADQIILRVYTADYAPAILALQILISGMIFSFLHFPIGSLLNASNNQNINTRNMGVVLVVNIIANLILIPKLAYLGASMVAFGTQALLFGLGLSYCGKIINYNRKFLIVSFLKSFLAVTVMAITVFILKDFIDHQAGFDFAILNLLGLPIIGGIVYFIILYLLKGVSWQDFSGLKSTFKRN